MENFQSSNQHQVPGSQKPLGELLVEAGLVSISQIEQALREQQQNGWRLGKILVSSGLIKQQTVDFFADQWSEVVQEQPKKPSVYYFQQAGLLDNQQVQYLKEIQKLNQNKAKFHFLAVRQGYLKQITIDFFLAHLFNIYNPNVISISKPYQVLKSYAEGDTNFSNLDLHKAPLMGITLKGVTLDHSNLRKSDLSQSRLSNCSAIKVNFRLANLTEAIFIKVNFSHSVMTRANLQSAHLEKTNFSSAILHEADFRNAHLAQVDFSGADLTKAKLPQEYPYEVCYNKLTIFDPNFNPQLAGWRQL